MWWSPVRATRSARGEIFPGSRSAEPRACPPCATGCWASTAPGWRSPSLEVPTIAAVNGAGGGGGPLPGARLRPRLRGRGRQAARPVHDPRAAPRDGGHLPAAQEARAPGSAREMLLTGRTIRAPRGRYWRSYNQSVSRESLMAGSHGASPRPSPPTPRLPPGSPRSPSTGTGHADLDAALRWESLAQPVTMASDDMIEGLSAQKRRVPRFGNS